MSTNPDKPSRSQIADLSGSQNNNVQIQGDNNVVVIGRSRLDLTLYRGRRREALSSPEQPGEAAEILSPYAMAVPLVGREREKADLWTWMNSAALLSIRVMTAPAGSGKTRLALELCEEAVRQRWSAGFVKATASVDSAAVQLTRPTLAVVDEASSRLSWVRDWLDDLASSENPERPLRILLLERHAHEETGWWGEILQGGSGGTPAIRRRLDPAGGLYPLSPLEPLDQRRAILEETLKSIGSDVGLPDPEEHTDFDRSLAALNWGGEPLFLLMAALTAHRRGVGYVLALDRTELAFLVAEQELSRVGRIAEGQVPRSKALARHMAAYVTLCEGLTRDQVEEAVVAEKQALRYSVGDPPEIYRALHMALPGAGDAIARILPDVVGEAVVLKALGDQNPRKALEAVLRAADQVPDRVPGMVVRLVQDFGDRDGRPLDWLDRIAEEVTDLEGLRGFVDRLPQETVVLRELSARITARLLDRLQEAGNQEEVARVSNNLSNRLGDLGRREDALKAVEESVAIRRSLAESRPDTFRPNLAMSLNNLSNRLSDLGRREDALKAVEESVGLYRALAESRPDAFRPDLARSLNNLSIRLSDLGSREDALKAVEESVGLYRALAESRPDAFLPNLASSLNNLSNCLSRLGRREDALKVVEESVGRYRTLAESRPDAFRPDLAGSLSTLSNRLSDLGRQEDALKAVEESVGLYRTLAESRPDAFLPYLAMSLNNLSNRLSDLGCRADALKTVEEAVAIRRALAESRPDAFRPDLASSFHNVALRLQELDRPGDALEASEEAVRVLLPYFQACPVAFQEWMGIMINLYRELSEENGRQPDLEVLEVVTSTFQKIQTTEAPQPVESFPKPRSQP